MSVSTGSAGARFDLGRAFRSPASSPGPRNDDSDVRLALSYDALKMSGTPSRAAISRSAERRFDGVALAFDDARPDDEGKRVTRCRW